MPNNRQQQPQNNRPNRPQFPQKPRKQWWLYIFYAAILAVIAALFFNGEDKSGPHEIRWEQLEPILLNRDYEDITVVNGKYAEIHISDTAILRDSATYADIQSPSGKKRDRGYYKYNIGDLQHFDHQLTQLEDDIYDMSEEPFHIAYSNKEELSFWHEIGPFIFPILFFILIFWFFNRAARNSMGGGGGGIFGVGKSNAKVYDGKTPTNVSFKDVAGLAGAKEEVMEVVDFLKNPSRYTQLGGKIPKGVLLVGPPGTGKTLLAKAVAGEAHVPFFSMSGSDFVEMFVGVGASRVRDLFEEAKAKAPCIVFIDEIDAVGRARGRAGLSNVNDERENTLNQLLTEMDGFSSGTNVIVLAATNRADVLDKALLRAGRFDRQIYVELPDLEERKAIFKVHTRGLKTNNDTTDPNHVDPDFLAKQTPGFSGADIANVCNEAALVAARHKKNVIEKEDFLAAVDRIVGGLEKRTKVLSDDEKHTIAFHESGHASVSWLLQWASPLVKVTIVPRGKALGAAWYLPEERQITTFEQLFDEMTSLMAGRAAEEVFRGKISTGALNDMERATKMAQAMVLYYGMSPELGNISFYDSTGGSDFNFAKPYSEKTAETIDAEVKRFVQQAYDRAKALIESHRSEMEQLASQLYEKEVLFREDLEHIYGPRPWDPKPSETVETLENTETPEKPENTETTESPETT